MRPRTKRYGAARGDELPRPLARRDGRRAWLREAKRRLDAERKLDRNRFPRTVKKA